MVVSIHAPTRGATFMILKSSATRYLFQSTRPRGARHPKQQLAYLAQKFQSTRPRGARPDHRGRGRHRRLVSIHAPTRGATRSQPCLHGAARVSIHAPTRGATVEPIVVPYTCVVSIHAPTRGATMATAKLTLFQSTRPRGARPAACWPWPRFRRCFNPRAHAGRDPGAIRSAHARPVSIHAPTRGATSTAWRITSWRSGFQSTRPRGARLVYSGAIHQA